jgi:acyl carrier protein
MRSEDQIQKTILEIIGKIAPEADLAHLDPAERLRDQIDFDSVNFLNFAIALQAHLNVAIPEEDYPQLATINSYIAYLQSKCTS